MQPIGLQHQPDHRLVLFVEQAQDPGLDVEYHHRQQATGPKGRQDQLTQRGRGQIQGQTRGLGDDLFMRLRRTLEVMPEQAAGISVATFLNQRPGAIGTPIEAVE